MKIILISIITILLGFSVSCGAYAQGYTGNEVQYTGVFTDEGQVSVIQYRRYHKGFFIDMELFNNQEVNPGVGYQLQDRDTVLDLRVNKDNTKLYILQRF